MSLESDNTGILQGEKMTEQVLLRIQQLAEQADNYTTVKYGTALHFPHTPKEWQRLRDLKFAELLAIEYFNIP